MIDDGSKDRTLEVARSAFAAEAAAGKVLILGKTNSGKAEALNYGIEHIGDAELFVGIDADTIIAPDAIARLVPHFINPKVGAIAGNAKVGNRVNLWTRWQALEYITSQNFERRALDVLGAVSVVPGAIGAWRVSAVREAGGYHIDTVAEDADLTMALLRRGYRVEYEDMALAYTEAPTNANGLDAPTFPLVVRHSAGGIQASRSLRAQRRAGMGGAAQHRDLPDSATSGLAAHRHHVRGGHDLVLHPETFPSGLDRSRRASTSWCCFSLRSWSSISSRRRSLSPWSARRPDDKEDAWLLSQVWLQRFAYRQLFSIVLFKTLKRALEGRKFAWDKLERTAAVNYVPAETRDHVNVP